MSQGKLIAALAVPTLMLLFTIVGGAIAWGQLSQAVAELRALELSIEADVHRVEAQLLDIVQRLSRLEALSEPRGTTYLVYR